MKNHEIEAWALNVIERVKRNQPNEDSRVELKREWIDPQKAARMVAGHANAAFGEQILWLIGVDQVHGVIGVNHAELANWHAQFAQQFDGLPPDMRDLNIPIDNKTVVALLFETDRAPFVVVNPDHGKVAGHKISHEVPWREGTSIRSARRADLLRLLSPLSQQPIIEILGGDLAFDYNRSGAPDEGPFLWSYQFYLYVTPRAEITVFPFHRCKSSLETIDGRLLFSFGTVHLGPPSSNLRSNPERTGSQNIDATSDEVIIRGPGKLVLRGSQDTGNDLLVSEILKRPLRLMCSVLPIGAEHPISFEFPLVPSQQKEDNEIAGWDYRQTPTIIPAE